MCYPSRYGAADLAAVRLQGYLEGYGSSRALELSRIASRLVDAALEQVARMGALLERPGTEVRSLQEVCLPKLLELQDRQRGVIRDVRGEFAARRDAIVQLAEEYFRGLADKARRPPRPTPVPPAPPPPAPAQGAPGARRRAVSAGLVRVASSRAYAGTRRVRLVRKEGRDVSS